MNENNERAHVSEELRAFARGELNAEQSNLVRSHLADCGECSEELAGLRLLLDAPDAAMDDLERARLHSAVAEALDPTEAPEEDPLGVWVPPRKSVWSRFAPSLGAVALLLVAVIAGLTVNGGSGGDDAGGSGEAAERAAPSSKDKTQSGSGGAEAPLEEESRGSRPKAAPDSIESSGGTETFELAGATPRFERSRDLLADVGDSGSLSDVVSPDYWERFSAYNAQDARRLSDESLLALKDSAPDDLRGRINWCANNVRSTFEEPLFTAYGSIGRFDTPKTLVLGFLYTESNRGPLSSYVLRAWNGGCNSGFRHISGTLD